MSLLEPTLGDPITPEQTWQQAAQRVTPFGEYLGAKFASGVLGTRPAQVLEQALMPPPADYPTDEMRVFGPPGDTLPTTSPRLSEEAFKASPSYRGQPWDEGMTQARAEAQAGQIDRATWRQSLIDRYQGGAGSIAGFVAEALPAFADPTNYVPVLGAASKAAMVGRLGVIAGSAAFHAAEAAANTALFEPAAVATALQRGQSVGLGDVAADIVLNAAAGSLFGLAGGFMERRALARAAGTRLRVDGLLRQADAVNAASDALAHEEPVDVAPFVRAEAAFRDRLLGGAAAIPTEAAPSEWRVTIGEDGQVEVGRRPGPEPGTPRLAAAPPPPEIEAAGQGFRKAITDDQGRKVGEIVGDVHGDGLHVTQSSIEAPSARGKGHGLRAYQELADYALANGQHLASDTEVTDAAAAVYEALLRRGYTVEKSPSAEHVTGRGPNHWASDEPVFRVTAGPKRAPEPAAPLGEAPDAARAPERSGVMLPRLSSRDAQPIVVGTAEEADRIVQRGRQARGEDLQARQLPDGRYAIEAPAAGDFVRDRGAPLPFGSERAALKWLASHPELAGTVPARFAGPDGKPRWGLYRGTPEEAGLVDRNWRSARVLESAEAVAARQAGEREAARAAAEAEARSATGQAAIGEAARGTVAAQIEAARARASVDPLATARPEPPHPSVAEATPRVGKPAPELETFAKDAGLEGYQQPLPGHEPKPEPGPRANERPAKPPTPEEKAAAAAALPPELQEIEAMKRGGDFLPEDEQTLADGEAEAQRAESYATAYETLINCVLRNTA